jgi:chemotaxis protein CheD
MSRSVAQDDILEIFLQPGEFYFGEGRTRIRTLLGSCVAVTLWHPTRNIGGMCHYMLPTRPTNGTDGALDGRYADEAMQLFIRELRAAKTRPGEYQVKLFGGGNMFAGAKGAKRHINISERNVEVGREMIPKLGLKLAAEDLGGKGHRNVLLELWSGDVWVKR